MRLPDALAAYLRELREGILLLPSVARELPRGLFPELERRAKANRDFWAAHQGAVWAMGVTVGVLWVVVLTIAVLT